MNRFLSWSLLILFLVNTGGFYYVFKFKEYRIKKEIKTKIKLGVNEEELKTFVLTASNQHKFKWKHSKEFQFNGNMYDVVYRTKQADGSEILKCVSDAQETVLFKHLDECLQQHLISNHQGKHPLIEFHTFLTHLFFQPDLNLREIDDVLENHNSTYLNHNYLDPFIGLSPRPPQV